jgi:cytochrome c
MNMKGDLLVAIGLLLAFEARTLAANGNPIQGQRVFGACAACHSLQPDQNLTGPSLAHLWNRKAGSLGSFSRYSPAMRSANVEWNDKTLDEWIADPQRVIPGNQMTFAGIKDAKQRADLIAFLKQETDSGGSQMSQQGGPMGGMGGMGGMMGGRQATKP